MQKWYICFAITGGFEIEAASQAEAEEQARLLSLANLLEQAERPVAKVLLSPLRDRAD
jgi:hypothetical protein